MHLELSPRAPLHGPIPCKDSLRVGVCDTNVLELKTCCEWNTFGTHNEWWPETSHKTHNAIILLVALCRCKVLCMYVSAFTPRVTDTDLACSCFLVSYLSLVLAVALLGRWAVCCASCLLVGSLALLICCLYPILLYLLRAHAYKVKCVAHA